MKLESLSELIKINTIAPKIFGDYITFRNYDVIFIFLIYGSFKKIEKLDS